jgi:hypothetical protein
MIRLLFSLLLVVHGLLHLSGFRAAYRLLPVPPGSGATLISLSPASAKWMAGAWGCIKARIL